MRRTISNFTKLFFLLACASPALAGQNNVIVVNPGYGYGYGYGYYNGGYPYWDTITRWDDKIFNLPSEGKKRGASAPDGRNWGDEREYTKAQRHQWIKKCKPRMESGFREFQNCFDSERDRAAEERARSFEEVERRQATPLRNIPRTRRKNQ